MHGHGMIYRMAYVLHNILGYQSQLTMAETALRTCPFEVI